VLAGHWRAARLGELRRFLIELTQDERILGAAACGTDLGTLASTPNFPSEFSCRKIGAYVRPSDPRAPWTVWHTVAPLPAGSVQVSAIPLASRDRTLGFVVLLHDMSHIELRSSEGRFFLMLGFGVLGLIAAAVTIVAAREDERGVLVLSQFTGAARELAEALVVNPYDLDQASAALATALAMAPDEQRDRMRAMRAFLAEFNVYRWAGRMLLDAARLRQRDRLTGRLLERETA